MFFFFIEKCEMGFVSPLNSPMGQFSHSPVVEKGTEASEAFSVIDVVLGYLLTSRMSQCALGVILAGWPLLGRFSTVLWKMALIVAPSLKVLERFLTFSKLMGVMSLLLISSSISLTQVMSCF
ncbi:hypothetical protein ILYODFUR_016822 [Ilyodon furcidens]|uniref:Uncharacterized protein n=1 Tax=Ilyodon furcidens TaxID=33524 RepID=A0ABV0SLR8_9TELE